MAKASKYKFYAAMPYPPIQVEKPNLYYARILSQDYAASVSEFSAVNLYNFQHWILKHSFCELSESIEAISRVEMKHLDILANVITLLGNQPRYQYYKGELCAPWQQAMVNYATSPIEILKYDIWTEEAAIHSYKNHIRLIKDEKIIAILERIIEDEKIHLAFFRTQLQKRTLL